MNELQKIYVCLRFSEQCKCIKYKHFLVKYIIIRFYFGPKITIIVWYILFDSFIELDKIIRQLSFGNVIFNFGYS